MAVMKGDRVKLKQSQNAQGTVIGVSDDGTVSVRQDEAPICQATQTDVISDRQEALAAWLGKSTRDVTHVRNVPGGFVLIPGPDGPAAFYVVLKDSETTVGKPYRQVGDIVYDGTKYYFYRGGSE